MISLCQRSFLVNYISLAVMWHGSNDQLSVGTSVHKHIRFENYRSHDSQHVKLLDVFYVPNYNCQLLCYIRVPIENYNLNNNLFNKHFLVKLVNRKMYCLSLILRVN